jgi:hypothetical protein
MDQTGRRAGVVEPLLALTGCVNVSV